jgi:hypothetical protein
MNKQDAINKLIEQGMTEQEANAEFKSKVNWYLRGTVRTAEDIRYATECAIEEIIYDEEENLDSKMIELFFS